MISFCFLAFALELTVGKEAIASVKDKLKFDADKYVSSQIGAIFATLKRELDEETYSRVCQALAQSTWFNRQAQKSSPAFRYLEIDSFPRL